MTAQSTQALELFYSYAHEDEELRNQLDKHLSLLKRQGLIADWHDRQISAGKEWAKEINAHLETAHIILLLISADFLASDYCYSVEMECALERHEAGEARVIPIILRPVDWEHERFLHKLQALPTDAKPVITWPSSPTYDTAFTDIVKGIRKVIEEYQRSPLLRPSKAAPLWNVPHRRNPFFTGRENVLQRLHEALTRQSTAVLTQVHTQAISGLGGIGKTQTALEYAYRYQDEYRAVLWAKADSREALSADFVSIAGLLHLPEHAAQEQRLAVAAVKRWLQQSTDWLLILDNADELPMVADFLPTAGKGHILLTTRARPMGPLAQRIELDTMEPEEGALLLLRRAGVLPRDAALAMASVADRAQALQLVKELDGLPLAIDQAGAYLEETGCGLSHYLRLYQTRRKDVLKRRGSMASDHPEPVATTWSLSFQQVVQANPAAADLLRFCAFLHPDAIPEELITAGAPELGEVLGPVAGDPLQLDEAIGELQRFSLLRRQTGTLAVHRLVQVVLKDEMDEQAQRQWTTRTVRAVSRGFPYAPEVSTWPACQRYLPHALECVALIGHWNLALLEAAWLLQQTGYYLYRRAQYREAEPLLEQASALYERLQGPDHTQTADSLVYLALLYKHQGKYEQAEPLYQRALAIQEKARGPEHPDTAMTLNNLAILYRKQGKHEQAEPLYQRALAIQEKTRGPDHPDTAMTLHNLAILYRKQGKYEQAKSLYQRALAIQEKVPGPEHPDTAMTLHNLAILYRKQGKHEQAKSLYRRALAIQEKVPGPEHPDTAMTLYNLALLYAYQGKYEQAEPLYRRALAIREKVLGSDHLETVRVRKRYANLLQKMKKAE